MGKRAQWARSVRPIYQRTAQALPDEQALRVRGIYDPWEADVAYGGPDEPQIVRRMDGLYRVRIPHTSQASWAPELAPTMWYRIDMDHAGTREDPIPYDGNMILKEGVHYVQEGVVYVCTRGTVDAVFAALRDLVGLYVEVAAA